MILRGTVAVVATSASNDGFDRIRQQYPPILTTGQVAELLDINPRTVLMMAADGRLPASRLPGSRKFHFFLDDVLGALRQNMVTPGVAALTEEDIDAETSDLEANPLPKKAPARKGGQRQREAGAAPRTT